MQTKRRLWVVEMLDRSKWYSTVGSGITRKAARKEKIVWQENNPNRRFRVVSYEPSR